MALGTVATAAPRVGDHPGFTRVVFDLPRGIQTATLKTQLAAPRVEVRLSVMLPSESGTLKGDGLVSYLVSGQTVTLTLTKGYANAKAEILPAGGANPARLVIDIPKQAAQAAARAAPPAPKARPRVVLDPGHGGIDSGMVSRWVVEKQVTLDIAQRVRAELRQHGVDVTMTREIDKHLSPNKTADLDQRSRLASNKTTSAFVSIHVNAATNSSAQGIETFYFGQPLAGSNRSLAVWENGGGTLGQELTRKATNTAQNLLGDLLAQAKLSFSKQLAQKVQSSLIRSTGAVNRGVRTDAFYVIRNPTTPAILIEVGFGSNTREGPLLASPAYREQLAQAIARAILDFLNTK